MALSGSQPKAGFYAALAVVLVALVIDGLDLQLLSMVGPKVIEDWRLSTAVFSQALASAVIGVALGAALGGYLGDRLGSRRVLAWSMFGCAVITASTALSGDILTLTIVRFLTGLAIGSISASALIFVTQALSAQRRASVGAITSACGPAGGMLGSMIVLSVEPSWGWAACFVVAGVAMLLAWLALLLLPSRKANPVRQGADADIAVDPPALGNNPLFVRRNLRMNLGAPLAFAALTYIGYSFAWTPVILTKSGLELSDAVLGYLAYNVMALVTPLLAGALISIAGSRLLLLLTSGLGIVVALLLAAVLQAHQAQPDPSLRLLIFAGIGAMGGISSMLAAVMYGLIACGYADECRGRGVGLSMMSGRIGGLLAIVAGGLILDTSWGASGVFYVIAAGLVLVIAACFVIDRHVSPSTKSAQQPDLQPGGGGGPLPHQFSS